MSPIKSLILAPLATVASEVWRGSKPAIGPGHSEECPPASLIKRRPARIREAAKILAAVMRLSEPGCYTRVRNPGQGEYTIFHSNESTLLKWSAQTSGGIMEEIPENMTADELSNFFNERTPWNPLPYLPASGLANSWERRFCPFSAANRRQRDRNNTFRFERSSRGERSDPSGY